MRLISIPTAQMSMLSLMGGLGRAFFKPGTPTSSSRDAEPFYWKVMHVDEDGVLQRSTVRVLSLHADLRRLTVWSDSLGRECVLRTSRIVEISDLQSGRKVNLYRWMADQQKQPA